ncbi:unnamed protein product [Diamesa serratosioi]
MTNPKKYLVYFAQDYIEFRLSEIESLLKLFQIDLKIPKLENELQPYWIVENVSEEDLTKLASRSMSIRFVMEIWSSSNESATFHDNLIQFSANPELDHFFDADKSFKVIVETYNKHFTQKEKVAKIETMDYLRFKGPVNLKNPVNTFCYFEYYGFNPKHVMDVPLTVFGKWISDGARSMIHSISLKTRKFIGNTSMNPHLSLLMANQGMCDKNHIVFDPFAGTGSMLLSAAKFGSYVIGSDIDFLMLHGKTKPSRISQKVRALDESIVANMQQYQLEHLYLDVFVSDFSNCPVTDAIIFDSIITDPPYGIREKMEKINTKTSKKSTAMTEDAVHYPSTSSYHTNNLYEDLLKFSAKHLKLGGRLVAWFPVHREDYSDDILPKHSNLRLVANSEQKLCGDTARRLLTYEKISHVSEESSILIPEALNDMDFRTKYFNQSDRKEKQLQKTKWKQINIEEALKRGKILDENGKITNVKQL